MAAGGLEPGRLDGGALGQLHPDRVDRLVLLAPGFDLADRWPDVLGAEQMARWQREGALALADAEGSPTDVHWGFIDSARSHPGTPEVRCPTWLLHGVQDEIVPIEQSRRYAATRSHVHLIEVDDDHQLTDSLPRILDEVMRAFEIE